MDGLRVPLVSIIVPTLNERATIAACLRALQPQEPPWEVLVADSGSTDGTLERAAAVLLAPPPRLLAIDPALKGRGPAYNVAAAAAGGEILLFLHADVRLPANALHLIRMALRDPTVVGGGFVHAYPGRERLLRLNAAFMAWFSTRFTYISGDQAAFVRAAIFRQMGGFAPWPLMEDCDLIDRLRRHGRLAILRPGVVSSPRRALATGVLRTQLLVVGLWCLYRLSVAPDRLATYYARWSRDGH